MTAESDKMNGKEKLSRKPSDQLSLDDLIFEMQSRPNNNGVPNRESGVFSASSSGVSEDVYALLEQKERDLVLAAELGKALLDKNEELSRQNERIAEEFSQKLEELEQEKYHLRRRLETCQEEYDQKVHELQHDIDILQAQLDEHNATQKQTDKEKSMLITTLTEQNQRLTTQLKEFAKNEEGLTSELQNLRDQVSLKRTSMNEHVSHLDMLRDEINIMTERKMDLERRIQLLQGEREGLSSTLDESADRIIMLEKQSREQDSLIRTNERALEELKSTNHSLNEQLESMYRSMSLSPHNLLSPQSEKQQMSLLNEMELSDSERSLNNARRPFSQIDEDEEVDEIECDHPEDINLSVLEARQLREEMLSTYQQMRTLIALLRQRKRQGDQKHRRNSADSDRPESNSSESSSDEPTTIASLKSGQLKSCVQELKGLLHELLRKEAKGTCLTCGNDGSDKMRLEIQLHQATEAKEKGERRIKAMENEAKTKDEEILELKSKLSVCEVQLSSAVEERDTLKDDLSNSALSKDELIKKAWDTRDAAVKRKNDTQIELARARIDFMQVNSQLLESIQQKVELSQQLDQWQADMEELLEEQMMKKMRAQELENKFGGGGNDSDSSGTAAASRKKSRILAFFQRS